MNSFRLHTLILLLGAIASCMPGRLSIHRPKGAADCITPDLSKIFIGQSVTMCDGTVAEGTYVPLSCSALDLSKVTPENLKAGITVANITGKLTEPPAACTSEGQQNCVASGALAAIDTSSASTQLKYGKTSGGVTGTIKYNCRNMGRNASYNSNYPPPVTANPAAGGTLDWWDTFDEVSGASESIATFDAGHKCTQNDFTLIAQYGNATLIPPSHLVPHNGLFSCAQGMGGAGACAGDNFTQVWLDKLSGLYFTNVFEETGFDINWSEAVAGCATLDSGDGTGKWRLPTHKELLQLQVNGVYNLQRLALLDGSIGTAWTATSHENGSSAIRVDVASGTVSIQAKTGFGEVLCVR